MRTLGSIQKNIFLIIGGSDKGLDTKDLISAIRDTCKEILFLEGTGTATIRYIFPDGLGFRNLKQAIDEAMLTAKSGDIVLFSPAFASFGMFKNEYDRNDQFLALVKDLR